jgi:hypothetical protein
MVVEPAQVRPGIGFYSTGKSSNLLKWTIADPMSLCCLRPLSRFDCPMYEFQPISDLDVGTYILVA